MAAVLTTGSLLQCQHQFPLIVTPSQQTLLVDGQPVLLDTDVLTADLKSCQGQPVKCGKVVSILTGLSTTLQVGGHPVVLATAKGATGGGTWQVANAGQTKLAAS
jgi:hypothetical protein